MTRWHRVNEDIIQAALAALPHRDRAALRDAAPALRDLTASIDAPGGLGLAGWRSRTRVGHRLVIGCGPRYPVPRLPRPAAARSG